MFKEREGTLQVVLLRPGSTDLDDQGRIQGSLDLPLNDHGRVQVANTVGELGGLEIDAIYASPCQSAQQTAGALAEAHRMHFKTVDGLRNVAQGLWEGKRIEEVRRMHPKVFRLWQEEPEAVCPPQGESLADARPRTQAALTKLLRRHRRGVIAIVAPEPLASLLKDMITHGGLGDLSKAECESAGWELLPVAPLFA